MSKPAALTVAKRPSKPRYSAALVPIEGGGLLGVNRDSLGFYVHKTHTATFLGGHPDVDSALLEAGYTRSRHDDNVVVKVA
jgi:hypothetical protein